MTGEGPGSKRKSSAEADGQPKRQKKKREWHVPRKGMSQAKTIEPGDAGIFVTCNRNQEAKCVMEVKALFEQHAEKLYGMPAAGEEAEAESEGELDIEADIGAELTALQKSSKAPLFTNIRLDVLCVCFIKTRQPIEPVSFVQSLCEGALDPSSMRTKWARRLTPMSCMAKATESGLKEAAKVALAPIFHQDGGAAKKFAIRPSIRNHNVMTRDMVIRSVAATVGPGHSVDLKNPDVVILVEVYTNMCGVSTAPGTEYESLKRFNLAELHAPSASKEAAPMPKHTESSPM